MNIKQKYLPVPSQRRSGEKIEEITYLVCHDTGSNGSTAEENVDWYIKSANDLQASAHAFVDDQGVIECIPLSEKAWHVRYNAGIAPNLQGNFANDHAIGIELCYSTRGNFDTHGAYKNYCEYIASLCHAYSLDMTKLVQHTELDPTRRTDPLNAFKTIGKTWEQFLEDIRSILQTKSIHAMDITKDTPQVARIKSVTIVYDQYINGEFVRESSATETTIPDDIKQVLKPLFCAPDFSITVE